MKNLILIGIFTLALCSCEKEEEKKAVRVKIEVKNTSTKNLKIFLFFRNDSLFKSVNINIGDSLIVDEGYIHPAPSGSSYNLTNTLDSAVIEFSDGKMLKQTAWARGNNDSVNNILIDVYYNYFKEGTPELFRQQFIITENDYLRAK